jgi:hypothetical protein
MLVPTLEAQTILSGTITMQNNQDEGEFQQTIFDFEEGPEFDMEDLGPGANSIRIEGGGGIMLLGNGRVRLIPPPQGGSMRLLPSRNGVSLGSITFATNDSGGLEMFRPTPDVDRDGWVTGNDMRLLLSVLWRVCVCREDANQDGVVNVDDIRFVGGVMGIDIEGTRWDWD